MGWISRARTTGVRASVLKARRRRVATIAAAVGLAALPAAGAEPAPPLPLAAVLEMARQANPEIHLQRERAAQRRAMPAQVSVWDDPTLSWEGWNFPDSWKLNEADNNIFKVSQRVPFPGKRSLAGTMAEHEAEAAAEETRAAELDVALAATRAYYDLWLAYEVREVLGHEHEILRRAARTAEEKYAVGQATQADALRAQVEMTHLAIETETAGLAIEMSKAELNAILSRAPYEPLGMPEPPPMKAPADTSLETLTGLALRQRPELAGQRAAIAREQSGVELARANHWPDFEVSVSRFVNYDMADGFGAMVAVTLPLVNLEKYNAGTTEARAKLAEADSAMRRWRDRIGREVAQSYARVHTAALQHQLTERTHVPQADQALRITESAYQTGGTDFETLLDAVRQTVTAHRQHVETAAQLANATADLERALGGPLPQRSDGQ